MATAMEKNEILNILAGEEKSGWKEKALARKKKKDFIDENLRERENK